MMAEKEAGLQAGMKIVISRSKVLSFIKPEVTAS